MSAIIINGLKVLTDCKFIKFIRGSGFNITDDSVTNTCKVSFIDGTKAGDIVDKRATCIYPDVFLHETDYIRINNPMVNIDGLILQSHAPFEYQIQQFIVDGIEEFYTNYNEDMCQILVPKSRIHDIKGYLDVIAKIPFFSIVDVGNIEEIKNIYGVELYHTNLRLNNLSDTVFNPKRMYERYLIRDVDYLAEFLLQIKSLLTQYGLALVRYPIDAETPVSDRLIYKISEYQVQETPKSNYGPLRDIVRHKTVIDFEGSFLNQVIFEDFRTKYQDIRFLTDFTTFDAIDSMDRHWKASVKWNPIDTSWNSEFSQDSQGNSAIPCNFQAELRYYVVYDHFYKEIIDIINMTLTADELRPHRDLTDSENHTTEITEDDSKAEPVVIEPIIKSEDPVVYDIHTKASEDIDEWLKMRTN